MSKTVINPKTNCWEWLQSKGSHGYGQIWYKGKVTVAHRVSYTLFKGDIPKGLVVDHLCNTRICINPEHLEVVTQKENIARAPWGFKADHDRRRAMTHCNRGHLYSDENTYLFDNRRYCRKCHVINGTKYNLKNGVIKTTSLSLD